MIRKNKTIKGIIINEKEYKMSYADDTQLLPDSSESTLNETLNVLNTFYQMSGLKLKT